MSQLRDTHISPRPTGKFYVYMGSAFTLPMTLLISLSAFAEASHSHEALARSDSLTLTSLVTAAMAESSELLLTRSHKNQAKAYKDAGESIIPGQLNWQASILGDRFTGDQGVRETEMGLQIGLWRLGERRAAEALGESYYRRSTVFEEYLRWLNSGRVRRVLADINSAEKALIREEAVAENLQSVVRLVQVLVLEGEVAEAELLRVQAENLAQELNIIQAEAVLVDAERNYQVVTGLTMRPSDVISEPMPEIGEDDAKLRVTAQHPLLRMLMQEVDVAKRGAEQLEFRVRGRSTVSIGARREQAGGMVPNSDTLGIAFSVPLGGKRLARPQVADALAQATSAEVVLHATRRELEKNLHEAAHELSVVREVLELNAQRKRLAARRVAMVEAAFKEAEASLEEVLRVRRTLVEINREADSLEAERIKFVGEYRQAKGEAL